MTYRKWTEDDLIDRMYGLSEVPAELQAAWESSAEYQREWDAVRSERRRSAEAEVEGSFLAEQRRRIWARLERRDPVWPKWVSAGVATAALCAAVFLYNPRQAEVAVAPEVSDAQFFAEIANLEQSLEPRAVRPVRGLFAEN
jgi:hypothetical protein